MSNPNTYSLQPMYGRDITSIMRRINSLEEAFPQWIKVADGAPALLPSQGKTFFPSHNHVDSSGYGYYFQGPTALFQPNDPYNGLQMVSLLKYNPDIPGSGSVVFTIPFQFIHPRDDGLGVLDSHTGEYVLWPEHTQWRSRFLPWVTGDNQDNIYTVVAVDFAETNFNGNRTGTYHGPYFYYLVKFNQFGVYQNRELIYDIFTAHLENFHGSTFGRNQSLQQESIIGGLRVDRQGHIWLSITKYVGPKVIEGETSYTNENYNIIFSRYNTNLEKTHEKILGNSSDYPVFTDTVFGGFFFGFDFLGNNKFVLALLAGSFPVAGLGSSIYTNPSLVKEDSVILTPDYERTGGGVTVVRDTEIVQHVRFDGDKVGLLHYNFDRNFISYVISPVQTFPNFIISYQGAYLYKHGALYLNNYTKYIFTGGDQTEWYKYPTKDTRESLGTPDGGINIPPLDSIDLLEARHKYINYIREAIESLALKYRVAESQNLNWTDNDPNNLYFLAMGDRAKYGATEGAKYDWTRHPLNTGHFIKDIDIGELDECVTFLENAILDPILFYH